MHNLITGHYYETSYWPDDWFGPGQWLATGSGWPGPVEPLPNSS